MPPLTRRILIQLAIFVTIALIGGAVMVFGYIKVPAMVGIGRYEVTVELPRAAGLYRAATSPIGEPRSVGSKVCTSPTPVSRRCSR